MAVSDYFSTDYAEARGKFQQAAQAVGARVKAFRNPGVGPSGDALFTDTAWLGPAEAERVLVAVSGTHGVEGFCGSGAQVGWLESGLHKDTDPRTATLMIHGINPHGFAWLRRVTEDNVDLNRNFVDHAQPYPVNAGYEELHAAICPREWTDATIAATMKVFEAYAQAHGFRAFQEAVTAGQYSHADGVFFGGNAPTWPAETLRAILRKELARARHVAVIDYHTGLGPRGHGERICVHAAGSAAMARAEAWYEGDLTSTMLGNSTSVDIKGGNMIGVEESAPHAEITGIALEYGTLAIEDVKLALRADNWLHIHGEPASKKGKAIKSQVREAFYQDADDWKQMIWDRAVETQRMALRGLSQS